MTNRITKEQLAVKAENLIHTLELKSTLPKEGEEFTSTIKWIKHQERELPQGVQARLFSTITRVFGVSYRDVIKELGINGNPRVREDVTSEAYLWSLIPKKNWLRWYTEYTRNTEAPLSYHLFCSLAVLGAGIGRKVYIDMGFFKIYPNFNLILLGPTGKLRKTTAANIGMEFVRRNNLCKIFADQITPEVLWRSLSEDSHQFIYAPEFAIFFNRASYNEGLVTNIVRALDDPTSFKVETIMRGETIIENVCLSSIGCTTESLLTGSSAELVLSSGFLNRFTLIAETETDRVFPIPVKGDEKYAKLIDDLLIFLSTFKGEMTFSKEANDWYDTWYRSRKERNRKIDDEMILELVERGHIRLLRMAMLLQLGHSQGLVLDVKWLILADKLLAYSEATMRTVMTAVTKVVHTKHVERVHKLLVRLGPTDHSTLLRKLSSSMDAATFRRCISNLEEQGRITISHVGAVNTYEALKEG